MAIGTLGIDIFEETVRLVRRDRLGEAMFTVD